MSFAALAELLPEPIFYVSNGGARTAYIYKPAGKGPFPVMVFNQATSKPSVDNGDATPFLPLAQFYIERNWALLLPGRPLLTEPTIADKPVESEDKRFMDAIRLHSENIEAAVVALVSQSFVDVNKIFVCGHSTGGINAILLAKKKLPVRGYISFSPGSKMWSENELLRNKLTTAVKSAKAPIFLIQPQNDFDLGPIIFLGTEISKKGVPNRSKVFDVPSKTQAEANAFAYNSPQIWADDVFKFIDDVFKSEKALATSEATSK